MLISDNFTPAVRAMRAAIYLRVSTGKQAQSDLSIPDQRRQIEGYCKARGWVIAQEFVDASISGTDENRPAFQRLLDLATNGGTPFDVIVVHSFSRFARDHLVLGFEERKLRRHRIRLVSITQELDDEPSGQMARQLFGLFDEYQSKENAKHTLRALKENARQGFWNGTTPPHGYTLVVTEQRGAKLKKRLGDDPLEAETVRLAFRLFLQGDGKSGPLGIKKVTSYLNEKGLRTCGGARWGTGQIHRLLTDTVYKGEYHFNRRCGKTGDMKPESEHIIVPAPAIIQADDFDEVQARLKERNPRNTPPRVVSGPILLTGIAKCGTCGGAMTLRTGKSGR